MAFSDLPFIGRQDILGLYKEKLARSIDNEGNILVIAGQPGIGKTRVLKEFLSITDKNTFFTCYSKIENSQNLYEFFACILNTFLNRLRIGTSIPLVVHENLYTLYVRKFPILKSVFPYEPKKISELNLTPEIVIQFFQNLTRLYPTVLVFDDLHNANKEIKDCINLLSKNIFSMPVLLVLGTRLDDATQRWIDSLKSTSPLFQINLEQFSSDEIYELNRLMFKRELPNKLFDWIYNKTRGNPLFTKEFLLFLMSKGIIFFDAEKQHWSTTPNYTEINLPDTLFNIIKEQFEILSLNEQRFIKSASLISQESFNTDMLNCKISAGEIDNILSNRIIIKQNDKYAFIHPLIKETIYNFIPQKERKSLHNKLGQFLLKKGLKEEALHQFTSAGHKSPKLLGLTIDLIKDFEEKKESPKVLLYKEKALNLISANRHLLTAKLLPLFIDSANSLRRAGRYSDALNYYHIALKFMRKKLTIKKINNLMIFLYKDMTLAQLRTGNNEEVLKIVEDAHRFIKSKRLKPDPRTILTLQTNRAFAYANLGNFKMALEHAEKLKQKYERIADLYQKFRLNYCFATIYHRMGDWNRAIPWAERALELAREIKDERYIAATCGNLGIANMFTLNFKKAEELFQIHQDSSIKNGWIREQFMSYLNFGNLYFFQGYLKRAEEEFDRALKLAERLNLKTDLFWIYHSYTYFSIVNNDYKTAQDFLKKLLDIISKLNENPFKKLYHLCEGYVFAISKKPVDLKRVTSILQKIDDKIEENEEYLILKGFAKVPGKKAFVDIECAIEKILQKKDYLKLMQLLIIIHNVISGYRELKKESTYYKDKAIECAKNHGMQGWLDILSPDKTKSKISPLKINAFGRLSIELPDKRIVEEKEWQWAKPRQLFTLLLNGYLRKKEMTRDEIGALLWPDLSSDKLTNNFHVCLNQLKSVIGKDYVEFRERVYQLARVQVDAEKFNIKISEAEKSLNEGKVHSAERDLLEAIDLYKGKFLEGFYDDWILQMRDYYSERFRLAVLALGDIYLKKAQTDSAIELTAKLLINDPLDEEAHRFLMHCYMQAGEKAKAIAQYRRCESIFKKELGCEPSEKTKDLYRSLL
ncbi:MAG: BTAD domain-containing putative transcriptional regulator [candidate division WOR-3 bacterium]